MAASVCPRKLTNLTWDEGLLALHIPQWGIGALDLFLILVIPILWGKSLSLHQIWSKPSKSDKKNYAFVLRISFYWINEAPLKLASQFKHSLNLDMKNAPFSKPSVFDQNSFNKLETSKNFWWMLSNSPVFAKALKYITVWWGRHALKIHKCEGENHKLNKCENKYRNVNAFCL